MTQCYSTKNLNQSADLHKKETSFYDVLESLHFFKNVMMFFTHVRECVCQCVPVCVHVAYCVG